MSISLGDTQEGSEKEMSALTSKTLDCTEELRWLAEHRDEYAGKWVALKGGRLLSYGSDPREVYLRARNTGVDSPVLKRIPEKQDDLPFGGW